MNSFPNLRPSALVCHAVRLTPGQDLKQELLAYVEAAGLLAPVVLSCVGSLSECHLRFANQNSGTSRQGPFEILSLSGMLDSARGHLHICVADERGQTTGGHVLDGCRVFTTAEVVIGELSNLRFLRQFDAASGYQELVIEPRAACTT